MKKPLIIIIGLLLAVTVGRALLKLTVVQDKMLERGTAILAKSTATPIAESDSLRVYVCGSASPLGMAKAQACIAVITPEHFYLIDSGAGSSNNINRLALPTARLQGLLITHFHSDHIAEIYEVNLLSWVSGRAKPLTIYGPRGVDEVTNAVNAGYRLDRSYRTAHHGTDLLPPALGILEHQTIMPGVILEDGDLKISAYAAEHSPVEPAVGYRFDYRDRSVVISGDSNVTADTLKIAEGADLILHDALSIATVTALSEAMSATGQPRRSKIMADVMDYHASTESLIDLGEKSDVGMVSFYHLVPAPPNSLVEDIFLRGTPDNYLLAKDLMWFELPIDGADIIVNHP